MELENQPNRVNSSTTMLLTIGGILIFLGIIVLIFASWDSFSATGRIITILTPLFLLYALAAATWRRPAYHTMAGYLLLTGSTILPFVTGAFIYQTNLYHILDWRLILYSSLVSFVTYAALEFLMRHRQHTVYSLVAGTVAAFSLACTLQGPNYTFSLIAIATALLFLLLGWILKEAKEDWESGLYNGTGTALMLAGLISFPMFFWADGSTGYSYSPHSLYTISLGYAAEGLLTLVLAALYSKYWQKYKQDNVLYQIRQSYENIAPIFLVGPAIIVALSSSDSSQLLVAIILGAITLALSYFIQVKLFRAIGYLGIGVGIIKIIFFAFSELSAFWPILLLVIGFLFIGLAFLVTHFQSRKIFQLLWQEPTDSLFQLGEDSPYATATHLSTPVLSTPDGSVKKPSNDWKILLIIIAVLLILSFI